MFHFQIFFVLFLIVFNFHTYYPMFLFKNLLQYQLQVMDLNMNIILNNVANTLNCK